MWSSGSGARDCGLRRHDDLACALKRQGAAPAKTKFGSVRQLAQLPLHRHRLSIRLVTFICTILQQKGLCPKKVRAFLFSCVYFSTLLFCRTRGAGAWGAPFAVGAALPPPVLEPSHELDDIRQCSVSSEPSSPWHKPRQSMYALWSGRFRCCLPCGHRETSGEQLITPRACCNTASPSCRQMQGQTQRCLRQLAASLGPAVPAPCNDACAAIQNRIDEDKWQAAVPHTGLVHSSGPLMAWFAPTILVS
jgi:hypothetical protein